MPTLTQFSDTSDGYNNSGNSATYTVARDMAGVQTTDNTATTLECGGNFAFTLYSYRQAFIRFDTSSIPLHALITKVTLSLWLKTDFSSTDFITDANIYDWGTTLTTADSRTQAQLQALTKVATLDSNGIGATGAYKDFTENGSNFRSGIVKGGDTRLILNSAKQTSGTAPTTAEYMQWASSDTAGTSNDPKLVVEYDLPSTLTSMGVG